MIHPQSVVHSLVEFRDGSYKAQLGVPDMRLPIQYALTHPQRFESPARRAGPEDWADLSFAPLDAERYPAYASVRAAAQEGGNHGTVINAADELAVAAFLAGSLPYPGIAATIDAAVDRWGDAAEPSLDEIAALDAEIRATLSREIGLEDPA